MGFIGGDLRQDFVDRIKGSEPGQLLAVPIDVGKHSAAALVCDFWGEIVAAPFKFELTERGFQEFAAIVARAEAQRDATWVRIGLEQAGHYHRPLQARLDAHGLEVTLFNPAQVKENRNQDLLRSLKSDAQVYRLSGLVPRRYESAGRKRAATHISREGKVELRLAIIDLGNALRQGHPDFARYARQLAARGKPGGVIQCALGQRANRVAFALIRDQVPFDPARW